MQPRVTKNGVTYECQWQEHRIGTIARCGKCRRGIVVIIRPYKGYSLMPTCKVCHAKVALVSGFYEIHTPPTSPALTLTEAWVENRDGTRTQIFSGK